MRVHTSHTTFVKIMMHTYILQCIIFRHYISFSLSTSPTFNQIIGSHESQFKAAQPLKFIIAIVSSSNDVYRRNTRLRFRSRGDLNLQSLVLIPASNSKGSRLFARVVKENIIDHVLVSPLAARIESNQRC